MLKPASEHAHARLLPRLSWSWTVLLGSDTHRKPITSITAVLLPSVTYLLTLPRVHMINHNIQESESASNRHYAATWSPCCRLDRYSTDSKLCVTKRRLFAARVRGGQVYGCGRSVVPNAARKYLLALEGPELRDRDISEIRRRSTTASQL
jgi:hypothetical protein